MLSFESDYNNGTHPEILRRLCETNDELLTGYGADKYCASAKEKIKKACGKDDVQVFFTVGGTQTNLIVIDSLLDRYAGVVSANTGHINGHESGAIERTGHKVLALPHTMGKLMPDVLRKYLREFYLDETFEHTVIPGMVYISHPTEYGTLYTKQELTELSEICKQYDIPLYLDGARLGYGLMSTGTDVTLNDIANLCDAFYIGGTKVGALCGEAVVFTHNNTPRYFFTRTKQHGGIMAKGRVLGVQFDTLFTDDLYFRISRHAIDMADKMRDAFRKKGYKFFIETITNQIFIVLENKKLNALAKKVTFSFWERVDDDHTVVRFASSWATTEQSVEELAALL
ncbi:MAG: low specificity L-threonine aldolase [Clostridia bacterium]|nr:low specificity L-threonine aldolase [Clostridia bacterium]